MGLDISVYQNIKKVERENDGSDEFYDEADFRAFVIADEWKYKIKNLEYDAYYSGDSVGPDFGYAYSAHSRFRHQLASIVGYENWLEVADESKPFYELLWFADNEGCLDWEISEKLYNEFIEQKDAAMSKLGHEESFVRNYNIWTEIFNLGRNKGVVKFH